MTITLRNTKGSELSFAELDGNFTDLDGRITALPDSAQVALIIADTVDSAYINLRATSNLDSAEVLAMVDSAYVQARETTHKQFYKFFYEADSGDTIFTGADLQSNTLAYDSATIMVYKNGMLLHELYDFTLSGGDTVTLTMGMDSGHDLIITTWK